MLFVSEAFSDYKVTEVKTYAIAWGAWVDQSGKCPT